MKKFLPLILLLLISACSSTTPQAAKKNAPNLAEFYMDPKTASVHAHMTQNQRFNSEGDQVQVEILLRLPELEKKLYPYNKANPSAQVPQVNQGHICIDLFYISTNKVQYFKKPWASLLTVDGKSTPTTLQEKGEKTYDAAGNWIQNPGWGDARICSKDKFLNVKDVVFHFKNSAQKLDGSFEWKDPWPAI